MGLIDDDAFSTMKNAIGLRNAMAHDYINFNNDILKSVVSTKKYLEIVDFLKAAVLYSSVQLKRIDFFKLKYTNFKTKSIKKIDGKLRTVNQYICK